MCTDIALAPLEGITGYIYRSAFHRIFSGVNRYFTPFITPHTDQCFNSREKNDVLPEHNAGMTMIPQILTNRAEDFIRVADALFELGYEEVNLNLGCPSGTVVSRGRGAGFLGEPDRLDAFLEQVFETLDFGGIKGKRLSVKTRLGIKEPEEFDRLLSVYNRYPICEVIVHARVREDYYKKPVRRECLAQILAASSHPVCYNGDIFSVSQYEKLTEEFPALNRVMLGRGLLANPGLAEQITSGKGMSKEQFYVLHNAILEGYLEVQLGERNTLFKMKELWYYMIHMFPDGKKYAKRIKKAERMSDYRAAVEELFRDRELIADGGFRQHPELTGAV